MKAAGLEIEINIREGFNSKVASKVFYNEAKNEYNNTIKADTSALDYLIKCKNNFKNAILLSSSTAICDYFK